MVTGATNDKGQLLSQGLLMIKDRVTGATNDKGQLLSQGLLMIKDSCCHRGY